MIDDEPAAVDQLRHALREGMEVHHRSPNTLETLLGHIDAWRQTLGPTSQGCILVDWMLREQVIEAGAKFIPSAPTIAQQVRSDTTERSLPAVPVGVISSVARLAPTWTADATGHDLFDFQILKERLDDPSYVAEVEAHLFAFSASYASIGRSVVTAAGDKLGNLLRWPEHGIPPVPFDQRIEADFAEIDLIGLGDDEPSADAGGDLTPSRRSVHDYVRFIFRELVSSPGPLLEENRVAAFLGVDIQEERSPDWATLKDSYLLDGAFRGPFSGAFPRWWSSWLDDWWRRTIDPGGRSARAYDAADRISKLRAATGLQGLSAAPPIQADYSTRYSTICEVTKRPLDPLNGLRVLTREPKSWQMARYVSEAAVRTRAHRPQWRIHSIDVRRAKQLQLTDKTP